MQPTIVSTKIGSVPSFDVFMDDCRVFVLNSVLVVQSDGIPLWEYVKSNYEDSPDVALALQAMHVMTEEFREILQARSLQEPTRMSPVPLSRHHIQYGDTPVGYKQVIPDRGIPELTAGASYRLIVFTSLGSANILFRVELS